MSDQIHITLPDGSQRAYPPGSTGLDIARSISEGLARNVLAAKVDGQVQDAFRPIEHDAEVQLLTWNDEEGKSTFWHSSAHLLAEALQDLYPGVKFGIGPSVANGFYYDIDLGERTLGADDLPKIEQKMTELARRKSEFQRQPVSKAEAVDYFTRKEDEYKLDLLKDLSDGTITFYQQGNFVDLCRGPHIPTTGFIKAIKLTNDGGSLLAG